MPSHLATTHALPVFLQAMALSRLGLIVAIGAQNAFVLRQGLLRAHVGSVVLFCASADALLIAAGVLGMAQALGQSRGLARALALAGALLLAANGWRALQRARQPQRLQAAGSSPGPVRPACPGSRCWAMARAGWRRGSTAPGPGRCSTA